MVGTKPVTKLIFATCVLMLVTIYNVFLKERGSLFEHSKSRNDKYTHYVETKSGVSLSLRYDVKTIPNKSIDNDNDLTSDAILDFAIYLRMHSPKRGFYETLFVQSMRYFWTLKVPVVAVLDDTSVEEEFGRDIGQKYPYPEICHEKPFQRHYYHGRGHNLQQLSMFYVEKCFHRKYVGFVDSDTMFVTMVTPEQLFDKGKPVIIGEYGSASSISWYKASSGTEEALGKKEVFRCMAYFPVIIKVKHLVEMRKYMAKLHKMNFKSVFKKISSKPFSQFSIMCNYLWYFHRDEYSFHAQLLPGTRIWKGEFTSPSRQGPDYYKDNLPEQWRHPVARATIHYKYMKRCRKVNTFRLVLKKGLCYSGGFDLCPEMCKAFNRSALNINMFLFEFNDWSWDKRCIVAQRKHFEDIAKLNKTETKTRILLGCKEVDALPFNLNSARNPR